MFFRRIIVAGLALMLIMGLFGTFSRSSFRDGWAQGYLAGRQAATSSAEAGAEAAAENGPAESAPAAHAYRQPHFDRWGYSPFESAAGGFFKFLFFLFLAGFVMKMLFFRPWRWHRGPWGRGPGGYGHWGHGHHWHGGWRPPGSEGSGDGPAEKQPEDVEPEINRA